MNAIKAVFSAFANLAAAINSFAATINVANSRMQEALDFTPASPQLDHAAEVIENGDGKRRPAKSRL